MNKKQDILAALGVIGGTDDANAMETPGRNMSAMAKDVWRVLNAYKDDMAAFDKYAASRNHLTPNIDRWYHTAAMYDATRGKVFRGMTALGLGAAKEIADFFKYTYDTYNPLYAAWEGLKDLKRNGVGVAASLFNPSLPVEQNNYLNNLQTPTMRAIMPEYKELKHGNKGS